MKFIWDKEIKNINWVIVEFTDGVKEEFSEAYLDKLITDAPLELTEFMNLLADTVIDDITVVFKEHRLKNKHLDVVIDKTIDTRNRTFDEFIGKKLWIDKRVKFVEDTLQSIKLTDLYS